MSRKHFYITFGDEIPEEIEKIYNRIVRKEEYSLEKDALGKSVLFGSEDELYRYNISEYIAQQNAEKSQNKEHQEMLALLNKALDRLKEEYPIEYEIMQLYYFSENQITLQEIGKSKGITKQAVHKRIKKACLYLKEYITAYKK